MSYRCYVGQVPQLAAPCRLRLYLRGLLLAILALSVIAWGTAYKCSLYHSVQEQAQTPAVKIDTRGSDMAKVQVEASTTPDVQPEPQFSLGLLPAVLATPDKYVDDTPREHPLVARQSFVLFFRPPPPSNPTSV